MTKEVIVGKIAQQRYLLKELDTELQKEDMDITKLADWFEQNKAAFGNLYDDCTQYIKENS